MPKKKKILCIADAPGPAESLAPVIPLLVVNADVHVVAVDTAMHILKSYGALECGDEAKVEQLFKDIRPDVMVSAMSSLTHGPYVNGAFIKLAHQHNIPVISLQDYWGNHRWSHNKEIIPMLAAVCVPDDFAASLWKEDGYVGEIFVTGNPAFDRFADMDAGHERERLRKQLHLDPKDHVILFTGQGTPKHVKADKRTFACVTEAIRLFAKDTSIKLIIRHHPRATEINYYQEYAHGIDIVDTSFAKFSDEILPAADIIVSMFSTNLIHACYLRIPGVSVLLPEWGKATLGQVGLNDFPPNLMGATVGVYNDDPLELQNIFRKIFSDKSFRASMREAQEKNFPLDAKAAQRVAAIIKKFI